MPNSSSDILRRALEVIMPHQNGEAKHPDRRGTRFMMLPLLKIPDGLWLIVIAPHLLAVSRQA